ncbi:hypothetical protein D3C78_914060 [compost metagenome]
MADGFVNLQHHLVGHQQQVADPAGGIGCQEQLQGLVSDLDASANQAAALDNIQATLLTEVVPAQGAALTVLAIERGNAEAGIDKTLGLAQLGPGSVQVDLFDVADAKACLPVH